MAKKASKTSLLAGGQFSIPWPVPCRVKPGETSIAVGAAGVERFVLVSYADGPDACNYITVPDKPWLATFPRIAEFDLLVKPNPSRKARVATVLVQGNMSRRAYKVRVRQAGRDA